MADATFNEVKDAVETLGLGQLTILKAIQGNFDELQQIQEDQTEEEEREDPIPATGPITKEQANRLAAVDAFTSVRFPAGKKIARFTRVTMFGPQRWTRDLI